MVGEDRRVVTARSDVVGSLLRPPELLEAREALGEGRIGHAAFKAVEDRAVDEAVALQEEVGLEVVTDGEMRRLSFQGQMMEAVEGFSDYDVDAFLWGEWYGAEGVEHVSLERPPGLAVVSPLTRRRHLCTEEFIYVQSRTDRTVKITIPSPSLFLSWWSPKLSVGAYPTREGFLADVVDILRNEVAELVRLGATYIQIDAPFYPLLLNPATRAACESLGWSADEWLHYGIEMDNAVMGDFPTVTFGFHLCRGNQDSRWLTEGGYDAIAKPIFHNIRAQRFLLEYDDDRSGSFEPLREVPEDKTVVLGLVSTKRPRLEPLEELTARIEQASRFVPAERLAISPQCGFASSIVGNRLTVEDEKRKLQRVVEAARAVWG
ncbi:cobalamin-independent methionine synthase II family protein [Nitrospinae bacterium AH_259_B05_G02_I21]|nr:cobalamin-independent methionine synthase II family protein [Nitrospinae bacterium AH_259_B05_G02_I21]